jgi:tape measure domain-containing protein
MAGPNEVILRVLMDIVDVQAKLAELLKTVDTSIDQMQSSIKEFRGDEAFEQFIPSVEAGLDKLKKLRQAIVDLGDVAESELKGATKEAKNFGLESEKSGKKLSSSTKEGKEQLKQLRNALDKALVQYRRIAKEPGFERQSAKAKQAAAEVRRFGDALAQASSDGSDLKKVERVLGEVEIGVKDVRNELGLAVEKFKELQKQKGFDRTSKEAKAAAAEIRKAADNLKRMSQASGDLKRVNSAISLLDKSTKELRNDFDRAVIAFQKLARQPGFKQTTQEAQRARAEVEKTAAALLKVSDAASDLKRVDAALNRMEKAGRRVRTAFTAINRAAAAFGVTLGAIGLVRFVKNSVDARIAMERIEQSLIAATGSAEKAGRAYEFVDDVVIELGLDLKSSAQSFSQLAAAAKGTTLEGSQLEHIFRSTAVAGRVLNLSTDNLKGTIVALRQTIGKARVSAEELRRQLGDRIPGAFELAARAMGVSTRELDKMMERGELLAVDLLPRLADEMLTTFGPGLQKALDSTAAKIGRLQTEWFKLQAAFGKGLAEGLGTALEDGTKGLENLRGAAETAGEAVGFIPQALENTIDLFKILKLEGSKVLGETLVDLAKGAGLSKDKIELLTFAVEELDRQQDQLGDKIGGLVSSTRDLGEEYRKAAVLVLAQVDALRQLEESAAPEAVLELAKAADAAADNIGQLDDVTREALKPFQKRLRETSTDLRNTAEGVQGLAEATAAQAESLREDSKITADSAKNIIAAIDDVIARWEQLPEKQKDALEETVENLRATRLDWLEELSTFEEALEAVGGTGVKEIEKAIGALSKYVEAVEKGQAPTEEVADAIVKKYKEIKESIALLPKAQRDAANDQLEVLGDLASRFEVWTSDFREDQEEAAEDALEAWEGFGEGLLKLFDIIAAGSEGVGQEIAKNITPTDEDTGGETLDELVGNLEKLRLEKEKLQDTSIVGIDEVNRMDELNKLISDQERLIQEAQGPVGFGPAPEDAKRIAEIAKQSEKYRKTVRKLVTENEDFRETFKNAGETAQNNIQGIIENFDSLVEATGGSQSAAEEFARSMASALREVEGAPADLIREFERLGSGAEHLSDIFDDLKSSGDNFDGLAEGAKSMAEQMDDSTKAAEKLAQSMTQIEQAAEATLGKVQGMVSQLDAALSRATATCERLRDCLASLE